MSRGKKKVGEALSMGKPEGGKGRPARGRADDKGPNEVGKVDVIRDDEGDGGRPPAGPELRERPSILEAVSVQPGDAIKHTGTSRPGIVTAKPYEPKTHGLTLLRFRHSRAKTRAQKNGMKELDVVLPLAACGEVISAMDEQRKWARLLQESFEDFEAIMGNPDWLIKDKAEKIELIVGTMHARILNFQKHLK